MGTGEICFLIPTSLSSQTEILQPQLRDSILPLEERRMLSKCLAKMRHLKHLKMRQVCNDEILLQVLGGIEGGGRNFTI